MPGILGGAWTRLTLTNRPRRHSPFLQTWLQPSLRIAVRQRHQQNGTLGKSLDGGSTWIKLTPGFFAPLSIQVDPSNTATLYVLDYRGLHKSTDGGQSFADVMIPISARTLAVDASGTVYVGGPSPQIYASADGAQTFSAVPGLPGWSSATLSVSGNKVYMGTYSPPVPFVIKLDPSGQKTFCTLHSLEEAAATLSMAWLSMRKAALSWPGP